MAEGGETRSKTAHRTPGQIKKHGRTYQHSAKQRKNRAARGRNRTKLMKEGRVRKGDGKHVDHKQSLSKGGSNSRSNLKVTSQRANLRKNNKK
jgi:5-methylcytosine-specific restriction endonuclease McrA